MVIFPEKTKLIMLECHETKLSFEIKKYFNYLLILNNKEKFYWKIKKLKKISVRK